MILLLDLGNTNLCVSVYDGKELICSFRTHSDLNKSSDAYYFLIKDFLEKEKINIQLIVDAILSSVIPSLTDEICASIYKLIGKKPMVVSPGLKTGLPIKIDNPSELGADLVCDCVGAIKKYKYPCIICDLGTANKILVIDKNGVFIGCIIAPGIKTSMKALTNNAAQLIDISYKAPKNIIGKNTSDSLNSGAIYGTIASLNGLCKKIEEEINYPCLHILTGGNGALVNTYMNDFIYDPDLLFAGLIEIYNKNNMVKKHE